MAVEGHSTTRLVAACVVPLLWMAVSSGLILLNKHLMVEKGELLALNAPMTMNILVRNVCPGMCTLLRVAAGPEVTLDHVRVPAGFKFPMVLSSLGQAFSAAAAFFCCHVIKVVPAEKVVDIPFFLQRMLPVGFFMAITLVCGNAVYMYLTVAFIQMLKAFTPVITMLGLFMVSLEVRLSPDFPLTHLSLEVKCCLWGSSWPHSCVLALYLNPTVTFIQMLEAFALGVTILCLLCAKTARIDKNHGPSLP
jgi:hypothetical protein